MDTCLRAENYSDCIAKRSRAHGALPARKAEPANDMLAFCVTLRKAT
jgi:hypothetical protein